MPPAVRPSVADVILEGVSAAKKRREAPETLKNQRFLQLGALESPVAAGQATPKLQKGTPPDRFLKFSKFDLPALVFILVAWAR